MIHRTLLEWQSISYGSGEAEIPPRIADRLAAAASTFANGRALEHGRKALRARGIVGVVAADGGVLEILPKIEGMGDTLDATDKARIRDRLIHMLSVSLDLNIDTGSVTHLGTQNETLLDALIGRFADMLAEAVRRGRPQSYLVHEEDLPALRGRLDAIRQFRALAASPQTLACRYDALSADIPLNWIMKATVSRLAQFARRQETQRKLAELKFAYADITAVPVRELPWMDVQIDRTNARWKILLTFARLLLRGEYQSSSRGPSTGFSLLFDMASLFESYIARTVARQLTGSGLRVVAQGGLRHCLEELGADGVLGQRFPTRPDIMIMRGKTPVLIIDTKWKRLSSRSEDPKQGVSQSDIYQMMAYRQIYECDRLMLLYPHHADLPRAGEVARYRIAGCEGLLCTATIDVAQDKRKVANSIGDLPEIERLSRPSAAA